MKTWMTQSGQKVVKVLGGRSNSFLIKRNSRYLLIDTGPRTRWGDLQHRLDISGVQPDTLAALVLTHGHFDHVQNAAMIKDQYKTTVIIHRSEAEGLRRGENPPIHGSMVVTKFMTDMFINRYTLWLMRFEPVAYDLVVDERFDLENMGFKGYLIYTPGHTPGSMSVIIDDEIAIVGDAMYGMFKGSVFPPFANDPGLMIKSWERLLATNCSLYLPAHGWGRSREQLRDQYEKYKKIYQL